jgi:hypothetical protein
MKEAAKWPDFETLANARLDALYAEVERLRALIQDVEYECCEHCRPGVRHFLNGRYQSNKQS